MAVRLPLAVGMQQGSAMNDASGNLLGPRQGGLQQGVLGALALQRASDFRGSALAAKPERMAFPVKATIRAPSIGAGPASLLVAAIVYDWRTRGRPHPVYIWGGAALLLLQVTIPVIGRGEAWHVVARWFFNLGG